MLPIGNLTVFLSVPPSYQYLHSPFTIHHSLFTIHISPIHQSLIYSFTHSPFTFHLFTHSLIQSFTIHYSHFTYSPIHSFTIRSSSHFSFGLLRKSTLLSEEHPKDYRTTSEGKWKQGGQIWSNVDKSGQTWTNVDKYSQT
jgi:hypothetical protein